MKKTSLVLAAILSLCASAFAEIVLPKEVHASSTLKDGKDGGKYSAKNLCDCTWKTWAEGERGAGIGVSIVYEFPGPMKFGQFHVRNGYGNAAYFFRNNRVKELEYFFDDSPKKYSMILEDTCDEQIFRISDAEEHSRITFTIKSVYKGTDFDDTCISEIAVQDSEIEIYADSHKNSLEPWFRPDPYRGHLLFRMFYMEGAEKCSFDKTGRLKLFRNDGETGDEWYYPEASLSGAVPFKTVWGTNEKIYEHYRIYLSAANKPLLVIHHRDDFGRKSDIDCYYFDNINWIKDNENEAFREVFDYAESLRRKGLFPDFKIFCGRDDSSPLHRPDTLMVTPLSFEGYPETAPLKYGAQKTPAIFVYDGKKFVLEGGK